MAKKPVNKCQFGDFQTPDRLAMEVVEVLKKNHSIQPDFIIEPCCGTGAFIRAAAGSFSGSKILGFDINHQYVAEAKISLGALYGLNDIEIRQSDFFNTDWNEIIKNLPGYILILGNPPWVTSSELGLLNSKNLPEKSNFQNRRGIEAITGAGNFDISEWMLLRYVDWLSNREGAIAVLCKYSVARKVMRQIRRIYTTPFSGYIYFIDAKFYFGVSVDACLFVLSRKIKSSMYDVYERLDSEQSSYSVEEREGFIFKDIGVYEKWRHLLGQDSHYIWRSGAKHDCSSVMEFNLLGNFLKNGLGEFVDLESNYLYPLLKSSDIANERIGSNRRMILITQKSVGEDTSPISMNAPKTWNYLLKHRSFFDKRASSIYKNKPSFSIFGIGPYTFKRWKIAISGLYKKLNFLIVGPINNQPVIFDDTVYFLSFNSKEEAEFIYKLLSSESVFDLLDSMIFWDEKRPVTSEILRRISLKAVAQEMAVEEQYFYWVKTISEFTEGQLGLGIAEGDLAYLPQ